MVVPKKYFNLVFVVIPSSQSVHTHAEKKTDSGPGRKRKVTGRSGLDYLPNSEAAFAARAPGVVAQTFLSAGSRDFPVPSRWKGATGKSPAPAGWKACATQPAPANLGVRVENKTGHTNGAACEL